ncbi:MAG: YjfB family protein, partial [Syntrophomonadaceae bacterium]|nr:YjfB family protein [Syntrophomonadaceae bacterium]
VNKKHGLIVKKETIMDIAALSMTMKQGQVQQAASVSVLKMAMDNARQNGEDFTRMIQSVTRVMEQSVTPHLGNNLDIRG